MLVSMRMKLFKNILTCTFAMTFASMGSVSAKAERSYTNKSILSSGRTVKIRVQEEGLYSFSYAELRSMGFSNPKNVHLRGYGGELLNENFTEENPYYDDLIDQPVVDLGDKIAFYLRGVVGLTKISSNATNNIGITENYSSDYSYYFLHEEGTEAKRIEFDDELPENPESIKTTYTALRWQKFDDINFARSGRNWYGNKISGGSSKTFTFYFNNMIVGEKGSIYSNVASQSTADGYFDLTTNATSMNKKFDPASKYDYAREGTIDAEVEQTSTNSLSATFKYTTSVSTGAGYIDYIIASAKCDLKGNIGYQMIPVSPTTVSETITYAALSSTPNTQVWDVSDIGNVKRVPTRLSNDSLIFTIKTRTTVGRYILVNWGGGFPTPEQVGTVDAQNLHALKDIEYVVVTCPAFISQANEIAEFHKQEDGMSTAVVTDEQVFNEFSSGTPDPTAIRAFMKMLYDKASDSEYGLYPQYLLMMGDGTYDNRGKLGSSDFNRLLTYQSTNSLNETSSYSSDDYFGYLENGTYGYNNLYLNKNINVGVGRFPVSKTEQAEALVNKVKRYYALEPGEWRSKVLAIADDNEESKTYSGYNTFLIHQEEAINALLTVEPRMNVSRVFWDNYTRDVSGGASRYPEVTTAITQKFTEGALIFNYLGHSSYNAISSEHAYSIPQVQTIYNKIYPVWFAGSCNLSQYDDYRMSYGEEIILNPNGGAIASIGAARTAYASPNLSLDKEFLRNAFNPENEYRLGKIYRAAKSARFQDSNKMVYILLGDPGLKLKIPELNLVVDSAVTMKNDGTTVKADTLKALSKVKIYCHVEDEAGYPVDQFDGVVTAVLKDKKVTAFTKGNNEGIEPFSYDVHQSTLYSGSTSIKNGKFELQMIIPKDINYNLGFGRLSMYAYDENRGWDAMGANDALLIGGSASDIEPDEVGPGIALSANGNKYKDGYKVNPSPMIYVDLADMSGINATGSSIGHNITLTIDDNTKNVISLNSYFKYGMASCTEGRVEYHIENVLSEGWHTIKVKAWDLQSNSSESTIRVYVSEDIAPEIEALTVYPNPVKDNFMAIVKTDRPDEVQTIECQLVDLSGRQISRKEMKDKHADGIWKIDWDLHEFGNVAPGVYILHVRVATDKSDFAEKTEKIVVIAQ